MKKRRAGDEEVMRKLDELMKDPEKFQKYVEARAEKALEYWRKR